MIQPRQLRQWCRFRLAAAIIAAAPMYVAVAQDASPKPDTERRPGCCRISDSWLNGRSFVESQPEVRDGQPGALATPSDPSALLSSTGGFNPGRSLAPNMIGDFFGSGDDFLGLGTSLRVTPTQFGLPAQFSFASSTDLENGLVNGTTVTDSFGFGLDVEVLQNVGDLVSAGQMFFIDGSSISPSISQFNLQSGASATEIQSALAANSSVSALDPLTQQAIITRIRNAVAAEEPGAVEAVDSFGEFIQFQLSSDSQIDLQSGSNLASPVYVYDVFVSVPSPAPGDFVGRVTFSDNNSPLPRDRVYLDYNYFHNASFGPAEGPVNRFTPGIEKTFFDGTMSVEIRLPMAFTLSSSLSTAGGDVLAYEVGDLGLAVKAMIYDTDTTYWTAGLGVTVPTADDFQLSLGDGTPLVGIENQNVRLQPYAAVLWEPNDTWFAQAFSVVDVDVTGNRVLYNAEGFANGAGGQLANVGQLQGNTLYRFNGSVGAWLARDQNDATITDLAVSAETHLTTDLGSSDVVEVDRLRIGNGGSATVLNLVLGSHMYFGKQTVLTTGYGVPLSNDRLFDGELRVFLNKYF